MLMSANVEAPGWHFGVYELYHVHFKGKTAHIHSAAADLRFPRRPYAIDATPLTFISSKEAAALWNVQVVVSL